MAFRCMFNTYRSDPKEYHWTRGERYPEWYGHLLEDEHQQLRWSVFATQWSLVGFCASFDTGQIINLITPRPGLRRVMKKLLAQNQGL